MGGTAGWVVCWFQGSGEGAGNADSNLALQSWMFQVEKNSLQKLLEARGQLLGT
jgi:hypothetical protein